MVSSGVSCFTLYLKVELSCLISRMPGGREDEQAFQALKKIIVGLSKGLLRTELLAKSMIVLSGG